MAALAEKQNNLRQMRVRRGLSQEALARLSGVPESTVARIDQNERARLSLAQGIMLASALQCDVRDLLP